MAAAASTSNNELEDQPWIEDGCNDDDNNNNINNNEEDDEEDEECFGSSLFATDVSTPVDTFTCRYTPSSSLSSSSSSSSTTSDDDSGGKSKTITLTLHGIRAKYPHLLQSTGLTVWRGSEQLCQYLVDHPEMVAHRTILEMGAGVGLCGMVASQLGAKQVIMTDGDSDTLVNMRKNVADNLNLSKDDGMVESQCQCQCQCHQLVWGRWNTVAERGWKHRFDVVMGADVAYAQGSLDILMETVETLLSLGTSGSDGDGGDHGPAVVKEEQEEEASSSEPIASTTCTSSTGGIVVVEPLFLLSYVYRGSVTIEETLECAERHGLTCFDRRLPVSELSSSNNDDGGGQGMGNGIYLLKRKQC